MFFSSSTAVDLSISMSTVKLCGSLVIDISGSMAPKMATVWQSCQVLCTGFARSDRIELTLFNDVVYKAHGLLQNQHIDWRQNAAKMVAHGGTALYNAIEEAIKNYPRKQFPDHQVEMIVLTDGRDTTGRQMESIRELVAHPGIPNFHLFIIGVGIEPEQVAELTSLCAFDHTKYLHAANVHEIKRVFQQVKKHVCEIRVKHSTVKKVAWTAPQPLIEEPFSCGAIQPTFEALAVGAIQRLTLDQPLISGALQHQTKKKPHYAKPICKAAAPHFRGTRF